MEISKIEQSKREFKLYSPEGKYQDLISEKINWLGKQDIYITFVQSRSAIEIEEIEYGGKVSWKKESFPRIPKALYLNTLDFKGLELIIIFLHECGHISDQNNPAVALKTNGSELSAWQHAINDFNRIEHNEDGRSIFISTFSKNLRSYKKIGVTEQDIDNLKKLVKT